MRGRATTGNFSMVKWQFLAFAVSLAAAAASAVSAADPAFNAKPGLWETTTSGTSSGTPPIPPAALAQMSPEQKAKLEAAMQAQMARANATHVARSCVTAEQLGRGLDFGESRDKSCRRTVVKRTADEIEIRVACTQSDNETFAGTIHVRAVTPEKIAGATDFTMSGGASTMHMQHKFTGKWLGADCGAAKRGR